MKRHLLLPSLGLSLLVAVAAVPSLPAACGGACACSISPNTAAADDSLSLSPQTQTLLLDQLADEGLAASIYRELGEHFPLHPFQNIPRAEDTHATALRALLKSAGVDVSSPAPSAKTTPMRAELIARGTTSEIDALQVGALIEERDITDLRKLATAISEPAAVSLIQQLESGSRHHLNAFVRNLRRRGVDYTPQVLTQTDFDAIIDLGSPGQSHGNGRAKVRQNS